MQKLICKLVSYSLVKRVNATSFEINREKNSDILFFCAFYIE